VLEMEAARERHSLAQHVSARCPVPQVSVHSLHANLDILPTARLTFDLLRLYAKSFLPQSPQRTRTIDPRPLRRIHKGDLGGLFMRASASVRGR